jgi:UDP-N-acetylmuramoyl-tripeptide--D-alanyl-D-alanine ligase
MTLHNHFLKSTGVSTDTRNIKKDNIFFALKGDNFNGNTYADKAIAQGASFVIIDEEEYKKDDRYILVQNVLKTLQDLASYHRRYLGIPIISLTGSNGKTTTKELINVVLSKGFKTVATLGNLNNHIGVPLTLLSMTKDTELGIVEMGANHIGEIEMLCNIAQPDFGYITNFGKAHLEGFGSEEGVVIGKSELYKHLQKHNKFAFVNLNDTKQVSLTKGMNIFSFGSEDADVLVSFKKVNPLVEMSLDNLTINSNLIGVYNSNNIAAAVAIGRYFKISDTQIVEAIESYIPANNRSQIIKKDNLTVLLDAYNANPSSMKVALENLETLRDSPKYAILGDMFELGASAKKEHLSIAKQATSINLDGVLLIGENFSNLDFKSANLKQYKSTNELLENEDFSKYKSGTLLIKGSRGMALECLMNKL